MKQVEIHPCFSCSLPDCDDKSAWCGLRVAANRYGNLKHRHEDVPEVLRQQYNIAYRELYGLERNIRRQDKAAADRGARP